MNAYTQVAGNLTADPVLREHEGRPVASMRVASSDGPTTFFDVSVWGVQGQNAAKSFRKGDAVVVVGRLSMRHWTPTKGPHAGQEQVTPEVVADVIAPDLRFATVAITKVVGRAEQTVE